MWFHWSPRTRSLFQHLYFAWLMSMIPHRKEDSQREGLQYNPFALAAVCKGGWQRLWHADPAGHILPWGHKAWQLSSPSFPHKVRSGPSSPVHRAMTCPETSPAHPVALQDVWGGQPEPHKVTNGFENVSCDMSGYKTPFPWSTGKSSLMREEPTEIQESGKNAGLGRKKNPV